MRILGIDPGLANTGWAVLEVCGTSYKPLAYGCTHTTATQPLVARLARISHDISMALTKYEPQAVGIEKVFFGRNVSAEVGTAQARGAALVACAPLADHVGEYAPLQIKQSLVGTGSADKQQVIYMVRHTLGLDHDPKPDHCADAFAAALCHAHVTQTRDIIGAAEEVLGS